MFGARGRFGENKKNKSEGGEDSRHKKSYLFFMSWMTDLLVNVIFVINPSLGPELI